MVDEIITRQELIDAKRDARDLGKAVNEKVIVSPRYGNPFRSLPMISAEFQISSDAAEVAAGAAAESANIAQSSANIAEAAATAATIGADVFGTPEAGVDPVTGVADGAYFNVRSSSDESYVDEYQNIGGVPTPTGKAYPSGAALTGVKEAIIDPITNKPSAEKVFTTSGDNLQEFVDQTNDLSLNVYMRNIYSHKDAITATNKNGSSNWRDWDWEEAIIGCITYCTANNLTLTMPNGNIRYKGDLTFTCDVEAPQTRMIKVGSGVIQAQANFKVRAIRTVDGSILSGDTSRGLEIRSVTERCNVHVSEITGHGGDGAVLLKGNLSNIWVKSTRNGGRGFAIAADGAGDVRANTIYTEVTRNCLNLTDVPQFEIEDYLTAGAPDNTKTAAYNRIVVITQNCESGPGYALRGRSQFVEVYSENNKSLGILDTSLDGSEITLLNHAIISLTDNSNQSNTISSLFSNGRRTKSLVHSSHYVLSDLSMVSQLNFEQTADRTFTMAASGSSTASALIFDPALLKLRYGTTGLACNNLQTGSLNFGAIPAGAVVERTKDISALTLPTYVTVSSTPNFAIPAGLVWSSYIQDGAIRVRVHNTTGAAIEVNGAWAHHIHGVNTNQ